MNSGYRGHPTLGGASSSTRTQSMRIVQQRPTEDRMHRVIIPDYGLQWIILVQWLRATVQDVQERAIQEASLENDAYLITLPRELMPYELEQLEALRVHRTQRTGNEAEYQDER